MEIERKYTIKQLPSDLDQYSFHLIEQAYLNTSPVIRIRRQDDTYYLTYKGGGMISREEYNLPLNAESYAHLLPKADGNIIRKKRFLIPLDNPQFQDGFEMPVDTALTIELDIFEGAFDSLIIAEIEFPTREMADALIPPDWFEEDVSLRREYHNSYLSHVDLTNR